MQTVVATDVDSILEHRTREVLVDAGLGDPSVGHPVQCGSVTLHVDLAYPGARIAIECDGYAFHSSPESFELDRRRWATLRQAGWTVVWTTWQRTHEDTRGLVAEVERALERSV